MRAVNPFAATHAKDAVHAALDAARAANDAGAIRPLLADLDDWRDRTMEAAHVVSV